MTVEKKKGKKKKEKKKEKKRKWLHFHREWRGRGGGGGAGLGFYAVGRDKDGSSFAVAILGKIRDCCFGGQDPGTGFTSLPLASLFG